MRTFAWPVLSAAILTFVACSGSDSAGIAPAASAGPSASGGPSNPSGTPDDAGADALAVTPPEPPSVIGTRFEATAKEWAVPATGGFAEGGFAQTASDRWLTVDMDGDDKPELVSVAALVGGDVEVWGFGVSPHWNVYKNTGGGFATAPTAWPVPTAGGFVDRGYAASTNERWATLDIDGDKKPDLVSTSEIVASLTQIWGYGTSPHWNVYKNTGAGFAATATTWSVPTTGGFADGGYAQASFSRWLTIDMDGDGKPDLVSTAELVSNSGRVWGFGTSPHWNVYKNTGAGFAATPIAWSVPATGGYTASGYSESGGTRWSTFDIDADGKPDLVSTSDLVGSDLKIWGQGASPHWNVYKNTGAGFAATPIAWSVPSAGGDATGGYMTTMGTRWSTFDIDGDGKADLVSTADLVGGEAQVWSVATSPHWNVYRNTGAGFASAATSWPVPAEGGFEANGFAVSSSTRWSTLDIDGDHRADLVSAAGLIDGAAEVWGVGTTRHWKIFRNVP